MTEFEMDKFETEELVREAKEILATYAFADSDKEMLARVVRTLSQLVYELDPSIYEDAA